MFINPAKKFCTFGLRNGCNKYYIPLFKTIISKHLDKFQTEIKGSTTKLAVFKVSMGHPSKVAKLPIMSPKLKNMEYLNNDDCVMNCIFAV